MIMTLVLTIIPILEKTFFRIPLEPEVTPGLLAGEEPDAHQFNVTICLEGVIKWKETQNNIVSTQKPGQACMNE
jgi:hypothetical protein